jgi:hypothetical protein
MFNRMAWIGIPAEFIDLVKKLVIIGIAFIAYLSKVGGMVQ